jgi:hypothetical protein
MAITVNLPPGLQEQAEAAAASENCGLAEFVTAAVREAVERRALAHTPAVAESAARIAAQDREILDRLGS